MNKHAAEQLVDFARQAAEQEAAWADWHNLVFGIDGQFAKLFSTEAKRREFVKSAYWAKIETIQQSLREGRTIDEYTLPVTTASGKFVVRLPKSLHEALTLEARDEGVSLNQLVLTKLALRLKSIAHDRTPPRRKAGAGRRRP